MSTIFYINLLLRALCYSMGQIRYGSDKVQVEDRSDIGQAEFVH